MRNYVKIQKKSLLYSYYAYIDTNEFFADAIFTHWKNTKSLYRTHYEEVDKFLVKEIQKEKNENLSVEEQIVRAEEQNRQFMRDGVPKASLMGATKGDEA